MVDIRTYPKKCGKRSASLDRLYDFMKIEPAWDKFRKQGSNFVPGAGNLRPRLMLIGEAPGRNEDEQGKPFVGASGVELDICLKLAEMTRDQTYITNVVKYRPDKHNRTPNEEEIRAGFKHLKNEVLLVDPDIIVTLGRTPLQAFFPGQLISSLHGVRMVWEHRWFVPMYHPAAGLRNGMIKRDLYADFGELVHCASWM